MICIAFNLGHIWARCVEVPKESLRGGYRDSLFEGRDSLFEGRDSLFETAHLGKMCPKLLERPAQSLRGSLSTLRGDFPLRL